MLVELEEKDGEMRRIRVSRVGVGEGLKRVVEGRWKKRTYGKVEKEVADECEKRRM